MNYLILCESIAQKSLSSSARDLISPSRDFNAILMHRSSLSLLSGEIRVNEQLVLTCMHTLVAREHNRLAKELAVINPHWDDEILFQEARRIVIAEIQHITYNEFLPILLGKDVMEKFGLLLEKEVRARRHRQCRSRLADNKSARTRVRV